jgi:putative transposase
VNKEEGMNIRKQCEVLSVNRSGLYYAPVGESEETPGIMRKIDEHYLDYPTEGVIRVRDFLFASGFVVNHKRVRRLLRLMGLRTIYPKKESE